MSSKRDVAYAVTWQIERDLSAENYEPLYKLLLNLSKKTLQDFLDEAEGTDNEPI